jgi:hypothetical protein
MNIMTERQAFGFQGMDYSYCIYKVKQIRSRSSGNRLHFIDERMRQVENHCGPFLKHITVFTVNMSTYAIISHTYRPFLVCGGK